MTTPATIVWLGHDLRLSDHPALTAAIADGGAVVPVFVWAPEEEGAWPPGAASRVWLHASLAALDRSLRAVGSRLVLRCGPTAAALLDVAARTGATTVRYSRRHEPAIVARDRQIGAALRARGLAVHDHDGALLFAPEALRTAAGKPFQVFTPFWRACLSSRAPAAPLPAPMHLIAPSRWPSSLPLHELGLEPVVDWASDIRAAWTPGEEGAAGRLRAFRDGLDRYAEARDRPDVDGTSRLSPHLHFGELSPRQLWHAVHGVPADGATAYLRELGWREFAHHLLVHFPHTPEQPLRSAFTAMPWAHAPEHLRAWQRGRTGYQLVDAGMRQLWTMGWMHNRVRMVTASFLVKHLLLPWQAGSRWFWDTLVDADLASNTLNWQWVAGCGADAAPYFRVFNPIVQAKRHDPDGAYVARWLGDATGTTPIVAHTAARARALAAYETIRRYSSR